jgi:HSP20 family protein
MPETMIKGEVLPREYFTPFAPAVREFFDAFNLTDSLFTWPRLFAEGIAPPMKIEQYVEQNYFVVRAEIPGIDPEKDVHVTFEKGGLYIKAERRTEVDTRPPGEYFTEMKYGVLTRFLPLPKGVTEKDVTASYKNGILELRVVLPPEITTKGAVAIPISH